MEGGKMKSLVARHRLQFAVGLVILVALLMTTVSMSLYNTSGTASLDLSRPGYTQIQEQVIGAAPESFEATGPVDEKTAAQFRKLFDSQRKALSGLGDFSDASLDDTSLQLQSQ